LADEEFAIARLREALVRLTDDDHSLCQVAGERGIFCHGFRRKRIRLFNPSGVENSGQRSEWGRADLAIAAREASRRPVNGRQAGTGSVRARSRRPLESR
jgi:hypothetical protein